MVTVCGSKECVDEVMCSLPKDGNSASSWGRGRGVDRSSIRGSCKRERRTSDVAARIDWPALDGHHAAECEKSDDQRADGRQSHQHQAHTRLAMRNGKGAGDAQWRRERVEAIRAGDVEIN